VGSALFFFDNDSAYLRWLANHPNGYVVNTTRAASSGYMVLHRARCLAISEYTARNKPGAFTERDYAKACAERLEDLRTWVRAHGRPNGTFTSEGCSRCRPAARK
jgi:hypothetical protein